MQATKANGQPDWQVRISAARALATLPTEEAEPELDLEPETIVYDLPPGSSPILHRAPLPFSEPAGNREPAEPLPEPGHYFLQQREGPMLLLVKHTLAGGKAPVHLLPSHKAGADKA